MLTYLRQFDDPDPATPDTYRLNRASDASDVIGAIRADGGDAVAIEADLADDATPAALFDAAEDHYGPVGILVNNASGPSGSRDSWSARTRTGRQPSSAGDWMRPPGIDAGAPRILRHEACKHYGLKRSQLFRSICGRRV